ncbi:MAG: hypothetical protein KF891_19165 [Rhizobacter sp.]|nr:hypothetical protein [Rhizobacter sp.]
MNTRPITPLKALGLAAVLLGGAMAGSMAEAHPRGRVGVWIGGPFWWPGYWGYPYVVERPVIVQPPAEPLVLQPSAAQQNQLWYYCRDAQMYYPYVTSCPSPWQEVPATPAPATSASPEAASAPAPAPVRTAPAPVPPAKGK